MESKAFVKPLPTPDKSTEYSDPVHLFLEYPFSTDDVYQQGLSGIIESGALEGKSEEEKADILRRSQVYYFNRITGHAITVDDILAIEQTVGDSASPARGAASMPTYDTQLAQETRSRVESESRTLTFSELKILIEQGRIDQIPNNRLIPNEINQAAPSESKATARKKPWEVNSVAIARTE